MVVIGGWSGTAATLLWKRLPKSWQRIRILYVCERSRSEWKKKHNGCAQTQEHSRYYLTMFCTRNGKRPGRNAVFMCFFQYRLGVSGENNLFWWPRPPAAWASGLSHWPKLCRILVKHLPHKTNKCQNHLCAECWWKFSTIIRKQYQPHPDFCRPVAAADHRRILFSRYAPRYSTPIAWFLPTTIL